MNDSNIPAMVGIVSILFVAWITGKAKKINIMQVSKALLWLFLSALIIFKLPQTGSLLKIFNDIFLKVVDGASQGNKFVFGPLADSKNGFILAFQVLTLVIFFSAVSALFYKIRLIPLAVGLLGRLFRKILGISGVEALALASSVFVGIEVVLFLKSYLKSLPRGQLFMIITIMMSTVASTVLGIYVFLLKDVFPDIAGHLLGASLVSVPAAVVVCKLIFPDGHSLQQEQEDKNIKLSNLYQDQSVVESFLAGSQEGVKMATGIAATLIAVVGLKGVFDSLLISFINISIIDILSYIFKPFAYILGVNEQGRDITSLILAIRFTDTEVSAYLKLAEILARSEPVLTYSSKVAVTYALCGFSHLPSFGIFAGGISAILPERRKEVVELCLLALWSSLLVTILTGCVAKIFA